MKNWFITLINLTIALAFWLVPVFWGMTNGHSDFAGAWGLTAWLFSGLIYEELSENFK